MGLGTKPTKVLNAYIYKNIGGKALSYELYVYSPSNIHVYNFLVQRMAVEFSVKAYFNIRYEEL